MNLKNPLHCIITSLVLIGFSYAINAMFNGGSDNVSRPLSFTFLIVCLYAVVLAFTGNFTLFYKYSILLFAIACWVFFFRGYIFKSYYDERFEEMLTELEQSQEAEKKAYYEKLRKKQTQGL